jgi:hypothetical protein
MWAKVESNSVTEIYIRPTAITIGDINYPQNIMSMWSDSELEAIGIYSIVQDDSNLKDNKYYINGNTTVSYSGGVVTQTYGVATARSLTDTLYTAEDEAAIPSQVEGTLKTSGLKPKMKSNINSLARGLLTDYDWYTLRAASGGEATPAAVTTYQAGVRTKANSMCTQIDNAADIDALEALYVYTDGTRPLGEWPSEPS